MFVDRNDSSTGEWYLYDQRFGYTYFATEEERDNAFNSAPYIDQKHWYLGGPDQSALRAYPRTK